MVVQAEGGVTKPRAAGAESGGQALPCGSVFSSACERRLPLARHGLTSVCLMPPRMAILVLVAAVGLVLWACARCHPTGSGQPWLAGVSRPRPGRDGVRACARCHPEPYSRSVVRMHAASAGSQSVCAVPSLRVRTVRRILDFGDRRRCRNIWRTGAVAVFILI